MATFDFQIDESFIGQTIGPADGFVVDLGRTQAGVNEMPQWDPGRLCWKAGRFVLRGSRDFKDLVCIDTASGAGWAGHASDRFSNVLTNASIGYAGDLRVVCVQKGSVWTLTLSDQPIDRTLKTSPHSLAEAGQALLATIMREQVERELVKR